MDGDKVLLPYGVATTDIAPSSLSQISDSKLVTFAIGQQKKSRFQKAREGALLSPFFPCLSLHV